MQVFVFLCILLLATLTRGMEANVEEKRYVSSQLNQSCPNNCNETGTCVEGNCKCDTNWGGKDCSALCPTSTLQCDTNSHCVDTRNYTTSPTANPNWICLCNNGYITSSSTGLCVDVDECANNTHNCNPHAMCTNLSPGFSCACISPYTGDGKTCTVSASPPTAASPVYKPAQKITPSMLCWSSAISTGYWFYFSYHSILTQSVEIDVSLENRVMTPGSNIFKDYPGQTIQFNVGRHMAYKANSEVLAAGSTGVRWRLDGFDISVSHSDSDWQIHECPATIKFSIPIKVTCPVSSNTLDTSITNNLVALISAYKTAEGLNSTGELIVVNVTLPDTCTPGQTVYSTAIAQVTTSPAVLRAPGTGPAAIYLVFDMLADNSVTRMLDGTSATFVPKVLCDAAVLDTTSMSPVMGIPDPFVSPPKNSAADMGVFSMHVSWYTFAIILCSFGLVIILLVAILSICIWGKKLQKRSELV